MRRVVVAAIVAAAAVLVGLTGTARSATNYAATMVGTPANFRFAEGVCGNSSGDGVFEVQTGDSVTWANCTQAPHTVTGESFGSTDRIGPGESVTYTFSTPGEFPYHCDLHPSMTGKVTVSGVAVTTTVTAPPTTPTTARPTTTTRPPTTTTAAPTTTTSDLSAVFDPETTSSTTETSLFSTGTTRALGSGGDDDTSAGLVALLIVGLGAVGTAGALLLRRMRAGAGPMGPS